MTNQHLDIPALAGKHDFVATGVAVLAELYWEYQEFVRRYHTPGEGMLHPKVNGKAQRFKSALFLLAHQISDQTGVTFTESEEALRRYFYDRFGSPTQPKERAN